MSQEQQAAVRAAHDFLSEEDVAFLPSKRSDMDGGGTVVSRISLLVACLVLSACFSSQVKMKIPETSRYAPVNDQVDGEVSYLNAGAKMVRNARREDAYKKMYEHCGGPYEIVREEDQRSALGGPQRRIWFKCVEGKPAEGEQGR